MIVKITKLVGTPPRKETSDPVWADGAEVLRLRSGHTKLVLLTDRGKRFIDMPPGTEVKINGRA